MAIWQFDFYLVEPEYKLWRASSEYIEHIKGLSAILPKTEGWLKESDFYGENDKTCVIVSYENNEIEEVCVRLDLRTLNKDLIKNIYVFIQNMSCSELQVGNRRFSAKKESFLDEIRKSKAYAFVSNPQLFIENLAK